MLHMLTLVSCPVPEISCEHSYSNGNHPPEIPHERSASQRANSDSSTPWPYRADLHRSKTKKWLDARPVNHGDDDWGDDDDEYNPPSAPNILISVPDLSSSETQRKTGLDYLNFEDPAEILPQTLSHASATSGKAMYNTHPPVTLEADEKSHADTLRFSAICYYSQVV